MMNNLKFGILMIGCLLQVMVSKSQTGEGGGVWIEDGGRLMSSLIVGNRALDGFGVAGGNGLILNCTVSDNRAMEDLRLGWKPGDILCADGSVVDSTIYKMRAVHDAVGVVFWVNSNVYAYQKRAYIVALQEEEKTWGVDGVIGSPYECAVEDTACYTRTAELVARSEMMEAARWCDQFHATKQTQQWRWALPAGYQLAVLFLNHEIVNKILVLLQKYDPAVQLLEKEMYWCSSEVMDATRTAWLMSFSYGETDFGPGTFLGDEMHALRSEVHGVRPVMVY